MDDKPRLAASKPGPGNLIAGAVIASAALAPIEAAWLPGRIMLLLFAAPFLKAWLEERTGYHSAMRLIDEIDKVDTGQATVTLTRRLEYETGWLISYSRPATRSRGSTVFKREAIQAGSEIKLPRGYLLLYHHAREFYLQLPAARIRSQCCRHAIIAMTPAIQDNTPSRVYNASQCGSRLCVAARITIAPGKMTIEASHTRGREARILSVCATPRLINMKICMDILRINPQETYTIETSLTLPQTTIATRIHENPARILNTTAGTRPNKIAGALLDQASELRFYLRKPIAGIL